MYAITAASGRLGRLTITALSQMVDPSQIVLVVRDPSKLADLEEKGFTIRKADYSDKDALFDALANIEVLFMISGTAIGKRIEQHKNVVDAAINNGVKKIIYTSFPMRFPRNSPLVSDHAKTEEYIIESGMTYSILRNTFYTEMMVDNVGLIINKGEFLALKGDGGVPYISREDVALAAATIMTSEETNNQIYELTGSEIINNQKFVEIINSVQETNVTLKELEDWEMISVLKDQGLPEPAINGRLGFEKMITSRALEHITDDYHTITKNAPQTMSSLLRNR